MTTIKQNDFQEEIKRLEFTIRYIQAVIKTAETSQEQFRQNIKDAFVDLDWLDSSLSYINILTNAKFLEMSSSDIDHLRSVEQKPYFAKIQFQRENQSNKEEYYIGKTSLYQRESQEPLIVDWRSPVANIYYDGRLGNVSYEAEGKRYSGDLSLKRQFVIEEGELKEFHDIDLTARDDLLQKSLQESSTNRLTDIVATIQEEQNKIIRADLNKPIIVQGAAGSGKTTIALHRVSYFIYTYQEYFQPEQLMILAPNRVFIDYISEALPELGVEKVRQTTFIDFVKDCLGKDINIHTDEKLHLFLTDTDELEEQLELLRWCSAFKGSLEYIDIIKEYIKDVLRGLYPQEDFIVDKFRVYSGKRFKRLLVKEYSYLPIYKRIEKIKKVITEDYKSKKKKMVEKVTDFYDQKLEQALYHIEDPEKRKKRVTAIMDKKERKLSTLQEEMKGAVSRYIKKFPIRTVYSHYKMLLEDPKMLVKYGKGALTIEKATFLSQYSLGILNKNKYELEDLGALLILQKALYGLAVEDKIKNVIIDEAQDYSYLQIAALKEVLETDMFTIVGDLAQGIHSYRGITDWEKVRNKILPRASYTELQKSYRTTVEVMELANVVLQKLSVQLPLVEPVVRHGEKPIFSSMKTEDDYVKYIQQELVKNQKEGIKTSAIIGKTIRDCEKIEKLFLEDGKTDIQLLREKETTIEKDRVVIVPSNLSKGLEFDEVFLISFDESYSINNELDIKLLYVAMTRPLHRLQFIGKSERDFLLHEVDNSKYKVAVGFS